jgi:hypothetical protein
MSLLLAVPTHHLLLILLGWTLRWWGSDSPILTSLSHLLIRTLRIPRLTASILPYCD